MQVNIVKQGAYSYGSVGPYSATLAGVNEVAFSILIPAGRIAIGDQIQIYFNVTTNNSAGAKQVGIYLHSSPETVGAAVSGGGVFIAVMTGITTLISNAAKRHFSVRSNTSIIGWLTPVSFGTDTGTSSAATSAVTVPSFANNIYLVGTVNKAVLGDTCTLEQVCFNIFKKS